MQDIDEFLKTSKDRIQKILNQLNWTEEDVFRDFNTNSVASSKETNLDFLENNEEPLLPSNCAESNSVVLGNDELQQLLGNPTAKAPKAFSDLQVNFSREEKLQLYEYTVKQKSGNNFSCFEEDELVSLADIVAMKKREKKNRRKYRISKPTQTEEVRSLVELQMQALKQYLETKFSKPYKKDPPRTNTNDKETKISKECILSNEYNEKPGEHKKCYEQKFRDSLSASERDFRSKFFHDRSKPDSYKERNRSRSKSRNRNQHKNRSRSPSRHKSSHKRSRSEKKKKKKHHKEKHKKSHKSSNHRSRS